MKDQITLPFTLGFFQGSAKTNGSSASPGFETLFMEVQDEPWAIYMIC